MSSIACAALKATTSLINDETKPTINISGALTIKMNNACCQLNGSVPRTAGSTKALMIVKTGETMLKKINEIIRVANKRYLILFLYVSFGTPNNAVNHLPIAVNGIKFEIRSDNMRAITKLVAILSQSIVTKDIVKTPDSKSDCAEIADAKHKKNETGISQIKL